MNKYPSLQTDKTALKVFTNHFGYCIQDLVFHIFYQADFEHSL